MSEMFDVVSVGSATVDVLVKSEAFQVRGRNLCEVYGAKMEVEEAVVEIGGSATNSAVSFARKELKTACVSEIGKDLGGRLVKWGLAEEGVVTDYLVEEEGEETAVAAILVAGSGERSVVVHRGASAMLGKDDFPWEIKTRWLHVGSLGGNMRLLERVLKWAKKEGVRVSFNPGSKEIEKRERTLKLLLLVEVLFVNREEAERLFDIPFGDREVWESECCPTGAKVTVVTDGARGGKMCVRGECEFWSGIKTKKVVDTTGAGDAFASGFVSAVLYGLDYRMALEWGKKNAASVIKYMGAKRGLLSLAEIR